MNKSKSGGSNNIFLSKNSLPPYIFTFICIIAATITLIYQTGDNKVVVKPGDKFVLKGVDPNKLNYECGLYKFYNSSVDSMWVTGTEFDSCRQPYCPSYPKLKVGEVKKFYGKMPHKISYRNFSVRYFNPRYDSLVITYNDCN